MNDRVEVYETIDKEKMNICDAMHVYVYCNCLQFHIYNIIIVVLRINTLFVEKPCESECMHFAWHCHSFWNVQHVGFGFPSEPVCH